MWAAQERNKGDNGKGEAQKQESIAGLIAEILCDHALQEKAIIGRLGLFIKRASLIESGEDLTKKSHQLILGRNYE